MAEADSGLRGPQRTPPRVVSCREAGVQAAKDKLKGFLVAWREKGGSRPLAGWWDKALECQKSLGRTWLVCAGKPTAGESRAGKTGRPV